MFNSRLTLLPCILYVQLALFPSTCAAKYFKRCELDLNIEFVLYDKSNNDYILEIDGKFVDEPDRMNNVFSTNSTGGSIFEVRQCSCAGSSGDSNTTYCIVENDENVCSIPNDGTGAVCYHETHLEVFAGNAWPTSLLWLSAILIYSFLTEGGRFGLKYFFSKICCCLPCRFSNSSNDAIIDDILRSEAQSRFQRGMTRRQSTPVTYILKTKEYLKENDSDYLYQAELPSSPSSSDNVTYENTSSDNSGDEKSPNDVDDYGEFDGDSAVCTICLLELENGDRIGALTCGHEFHVDCLKEWIKRRNACPLCQSPGIAKEKASPTNNNYDDVEGIPQLGSVRGTRSQINTTSAATMNSLRLWFGRDGGDNTQRQLFHRRGPIVRNLTNPMPTSIIQIQRGSSGGSRQRRQGTSRRNHDL